MNSEKTEIGNLVISQKGRDCNQISMIYKILDNNYVLTVNGKDRKFSNPKKKNKKHLRHLGVNYKLAEKIESGINILDAEICSVIKDAEKNLKSGGN